MLRFHDSRITIVTMKRFMVAVAALLLTAATACTPEQIATLGVTEPVAVQVLTDLPDVPVGLKDGSVLELDGSITSVQVAERLGPVVTEESGGLRGMPFAPPGLEGCDKASFYRQQAGLPGQFDRIIFRESNCRNDVRNSCCFGLLQQHQGNWHGTSYIGRWNRECDAFSIWDIYGNEPIKWQKHMCTAKVMYDISGMQPWSQTR